MGKLLTQEDWGLIQNYINVSILVGISTAIGDQQDTATMALKLEQVKKEIEERFVEESEEPPLIIT